MAENATGLWTIASGLVPVVNNDETFTEFYNTITLIGQTNSIPHFGQLLHWRFKLHLIINFRSRDVGTMNGAVPEEKCRP